jgi:hypothetical protein
MVSKLVPWQQAFENNPSLFSSVLPLQMFKNAVANTENLKI